jgi:1D-myo-inositol-triphosphate 3-kinase
LVLLETISSTATLGFRLEGVKKSDGSSSKDFKTTKTKDQVAEAFKNFTSSKCDTVNQYLDRLRTIKPALEDSEFFRTHELIGSSLLFVHDSTKACVWLIDFGKTVPLPEGLSIDHKTPWVEALFYQNLSAIHKLW